MRIGTIDFTKHLPCVIVAELGTLHSDSFENLMQATADAIEHGADMVKTQMINWQTAWWADEAQKERYAALQWDRKTWARYFQEANAIREYVPVFASIWDKHYLTKEILRVLPAIKLGYKANSSPDLIEAVTQTEKPVIWSTRETDEWIGCRKKGPNPNVLPLYCVPTYPIDERNFRLPVFGKFWQGASLHTNNLRILGAAIAMGAKMIEVHVKGHGANGPDCSFALSMEELEILTFIRDDLYNIIP